MTSKFSTGPSFSVPKGFLAGGGCVGIKKKADALDVAILHSTSPCTSASVFTLNRVRAAPVLVCETLRSTQVGVQSVFVNSGCANAVTGEKGLKDAWRLHEVMEETGYGKSFVLSTGVIGQFLPMEKIEKGIREKGCIGNGSNTLEESEQGWSQAAKAIMTTDLYPKLASRAVQTHTGETFTVSGICKGAGMIHPNMATMLAVLATDAAIPQPTLQSLLQSVVNRTFNCISVDGDTSTNDTVVLLANGQASPSPLAGEDLNGFETALESVCRELAQLIVKDGEGATKFVTITVEGGASFEECKKVATTIATSSLCKTAFFGQDANWGRIIAAIGYSGVQVTPSEIGLWLEESKAEDLPEPTTVTTIPLLLDGQPCPFDEDSASAILQKPQFSFRTRIGAGSHKATVWTCDLTFDYVRINASYRS